MYVIQKNTIYYNQLGIYGNICITKKFNLPPKN